MRAAPGPSGFVGLRRRAFAAVGAVAAQLTASARAADAASRSPCWPVVRAAGGRRHLLAGRAPVAVVALTDRLGPADPPVRGDRWWVALVPVVFAAAGGRRGRRPAGPARPGRRPGPAPARPGHRRPRPQHAARPGVAAAACLLPRLAESASSYWPWCWATWPPDLGGLLDSPGAQDLITRMGGVQGLTDAFLGTEFGAGGRGRRGVRRAGGAAAARGGVGAARRAGAGHGRHPVGRGWPATFWWRWRPRPALMLAMGLFVGLAHGAAHRGRARHDGHDGGCGAGAGAGRLGRDRPGRGAVTGCCRGPPWWPGSPWWPSSSSASSAR